MNHAVHCTRVARWLACSLGLLFFVAGLSLPLQAQGSPFATNTPAAPSSSGGSTGGALFATNTPPGAADPVPTVSTPTPAPRGPEAALDFYASRLWLEGPMIDLIARQIAALSGGGLDAQRALQLSLYELEKRFPGAPRNVEDRQRLIRAMLLAPSGTVDMRSMIRPYLEAEINRRPNETTILFENFRIDLINANFDGGTSGLDAVVHLLYPAGAADAPATTVYEEYLIATRDTQGRLRFLPTDYELPALPFGGVRALRLQAVADVNRDGLDEVALLVDDGEINQRLFILGARNGRVLDLAAPGTPVRIGGILSWPFDNPDAPDTTLRAINLRAEALPPDWPCLSQIEVTWSYSSNFYRPATTLNARYERQDTLACALLSAEPLFLLDPSQIRERVLTALSSYPPGAPGTPRAQLVLAMSFVLNGQLDEARSQAQAVLAAAQPDTWEEGAASALLLALEDGSKTALDICEAAGVAVAAPPCDINSVLERYFTLVTLSTSEDLVAQLINAGFPVVDVARVSQLGRADRTVVRFDLFGSGWWGFSAQRDGTYRAERAETPPEFVTVIERRITSLNVPATAYTALLVNDNPRDALNILDTLERNNPGVPRGADMRYMRALALDLQANRSEARRLFYELWRDEPGSLWGQLAAEHLERR